MMHPLEPSVPSIDQMVAVTNPVVTDLNLCITASQQSAWLYVKLRNEEDLTAEDLVVVDVRVGGLPPPTGLKLLWESRPGGIWVLRSKFSNNIDEAVTEVDVLFGLDAVDPRPEWTLGQLPLQLNAQKYIPVARLTVLHGRVKSRREDRPILRADADNKFKITQISDTHMVTGLESREADPLTTAFVGQVLDVEKPHLVVYTGDQLHHDVLDSRSALFKVVAPAIERKIPFAAVFGNHDSEGEHASSRAEQMSMYQNLPLSLCEPGPEEIDGIGNYHLQILAPASSQLSSANLYFLDSHGQISGKLFGSHYDHIKKSQIEWFLKERSTHWQDRSNRDLSITFFHIPLPEFQDPRLVIRGGCRREPTEGPNRNSHFYDALVEGHISAVSCGHDHVNDFCPLLRPDGKAFLSGPWLCYGGGSGFGGYCSYGRERFHRRIRSYEIDMNTNSLKTWLRVEYGSERVDETVLMENGVTAYDPKHITTL
ncbi:Metallo-dependent phosphatase-like protein [Phaeosphaeria sp. MPI-PUGE-AT-0046c]|nr:Metallo-dependent phosphatase-like protein [Phaeosphaeria sp. MPI-PUGE-AT-0046c]